MPSMEPQVDQSFKDQLSELQKTAREADKVDKERLEYFRGLLKHPGWAVYQELLTKRVQLYADAIMAPCGSVDGAIALEWVKGAMSGVLLAQNLPSVTIAAIEASVPATEGDEDA